MSQHVFVPSPAAVPSAAPTEVGHHWVHTGTKQMWVSVGTTTSADWMSLGSGGCLAGTGSPEGVVTGNPGQTYTDTSIDPPSLWVKLTGSGTAGWRQLIA
jgi:hypothetical protein